MLLGEVFVWAHPEVSVFIHNYDYALPSGKGVFGPNTGSIKRALDDANVPEALQQDFVKIVIDRFTSDVLMALETKYPDRVIVVDGRNALNPSDWANELHPKPRGFKKLAETRWYPELWARGLAA